MSTKRKSVGAFTPPPDPLVEDVKEILVEGIFTSNWTRIETYHAVGKRLLEEKDVDRAASQVTDAIPQVSERNLQRMIQFAKKVPDLSKFSYKGKAVSWNSIVNHFLPAPKEDGWSWRIEDLTKINPEFLCPDRTKIERQVRAMGKRAQEMVGGIEVFKEI